MLAQVSPSDLSQIGVHDAARIDPGNGTGPFHGTVQNIGASVDPDTRAIVARIVAPNPGGLLKKQMYVDVSIESGRVSTGLLVPASAVLRDDENLPFVYVAMPDGSFARRQVTLGYHDSQNYDVTAASKAATGSSPTVRSSSSSCRANERRPPPSRRRPALRFINRVVASALISGCSSRC